MGGGERGKGEKEGKVWHGTGISQEEEPSKTGDLLTSLSPTPHKQASGGGFWRQAREEGGTCIPTGSRERGKEGRKAAPRAGTGASLPHSFLLERHFFPSLLSLQKIKHTTSMPVGVRATEDDGRGYIHIKGSPLTQNGRGHTKLHSEQHFPSQQ